MRETIVRVACEAEKCGDCSLIMSTKDDDLRSVLWCEAWMTVIENGLRCKACLDGEVELKELRDGRVPES